MNRQQILRAGLVTSFALGVAATTGCAHSIKVTFKSDPPGATLYQNGQANGPTPVTVYYPPNEDFRQGRCLLARGASVKWASGATASVDTLHLCGQRGYEQQYSFSRPDVPGREIDAQYALELERNAIARDRADSERSAATAAFINATRPRRRSLDCTSRVSGDTVRTRCD